MFTRMYFKVDIILVKQNTYLGQFFMTRQSLRAHRLEVKNIQNLKKKKGVFLVMGYKFWKEDGGKLR